MCVICNLFHFCCRCCLRTAFVPPPLEVSHHTEKPERGWWAAEQQCVVACVAVRFSLRPHTHAHCMRTRTTYVVIRVYFHFNAIRDLNNLQQFSTAQFLHRPTLSPNRVLSLFLISSLFVCVYVFACLKTPCALENSTAAALAF